MISLHEVIGFMRPYFTEPGISRNYIISCVISWNKLTMCMWVGVNKRSHCVVRGDNVEIFKSYNQQKSYEKSVLTSLMLWVLRVNILRYLKFTNVGIIVILYFWHVSKSCLSWECFKSCGVLQNQTQFSCFIFKLTWVQITINLTKTFIERRPFTIFIKIMNAPENDKGSTINYIQAPIQRHKSMKQIIPYLYRRL